jgi:hypothetical protein
MAYSQLYITLAKEGNVVHTEAQLKALLNKYNKGANKDAANCMSFHLQPLNDVHFNTFIQVLDNGLHISRPYLACW